MDLEYLRWLVAFVRKCSSRSADAGLRAMLDLNLETAELFDALNASEMNFELEHSGVLIAYSHRASFASAQRKYCFSPGVTVLHADQAVEAEPLLSDACVGALCCRGERHLRPELLVHELSDRLLQHDVSIIDECPCLDFVTEGRRIVGVNTPYGVLQSEAVVLAAGASLRALGRIIGVRLPVEGGRGYSFDLPRDSLPLRRPVYLYESRTALTPFPESTRVVGVMELGVRQGQGAPISARRVKTMSEDGHKMFRGWPSLQHQSVWAGVRPMTPDGLPIIGKAAEYDNVYIAGGHGMLGVTLSLRTGIAIANCLCQGSDADPAARTFAPARFLGRQGRRSR